MKKLVRDKIPDIIKKSGGSPTIKSAIGIQMLYYSTLKIYEEIDELMVASTLDEKAEEFADVLEALENWARLNNVDMNEVSRMKRKKRKERGGFEKGFILEIED